MRDSPPRPILVIGYGNELRGDDAAGPRVAAAVAGWKLPHVRALSVPQLTPELAEPISQAAAVVFVDAALEPLPAPAALVQLKPAAQTELRTHASDPPALLALAQAAFGRCPQAWLAKIPAGNFGWGQPLSPVAERGAETALRLIRELCGMGNLEI